MKQSNLKLKEIISNLLVLMTIFATISVLYFSQNLFKKSDKAVESNNKYAEVAIKSPENLRAANYEQAIDEDTQSEYVKFNAFFTRDLDGDGNAEKLKGTCKSLSQKDELFVEINVLTNGYLKDGVITLNADNFTWSTALVQDSIISGNYIGNTNRINLQSAVPNGSQKTIFGTISPKIGENINNYSKEATVTLTGTHVSDEGETKQIEKTINLQVDWYGNVKSKINSEKTTKALSEIKETKNSVEFSVDIKTEEIAKELLLKETFLKAEIPQLNGYNPTKVTMLGQYEYDSETRVLTTSKSAVVDEQGNIKTSVARSNEYRIKISYPSEAYIKDTDTVTLEIPVETYYIGFNNNNEEFENPIKSNISKDIEVFTYSEPTGSVYDFKITVGEKIVKNNVTDWMVSKQKPLEIYNGLSEKTTDDTYIVKWEILRGKDGVINKVVMKENDNEYRDEFLTGSSDHVSMLDYTENIGIYFIGASNSLGSYGYINVYNDETNELIHTFTISDWGKYNKNNPFKYENGIKHVRVETSGVAKSTTLSVCNVKEIDDKLLTNNVSKESFAEYKKISSYLTGSVQLEGATEMENNNTVGIADYEEVISNASIDISESQIDTQQTKENVDISIYATKRTVMDSTWKNGRFIVKLPSEIAAVNINSVTVNNSNVGIAGYEVFEKNGSKLIKIITENENEEQFVVTINCDLTPDVAATTSTRDVELYASNEVSTNYYKPQQDIFDINGNNDTHDKVQYNYTNLSFITPSTLVTAQTATNYDDKVENEITIAPNVADVTREQRNADINISLINNYSKTVSDVKLVGVIPCVGNKYLINGKELGSKFNTQMTNGGIEVLNNINVDVYYSSKLNVTSDLSDSTNGWTKTPADWSRVKTYLIDFGDSEILSGRSYSFKYEVKIPAGVSENDVSYSEHAVYFALNTDGGKLYTQTEPNKLGIRVVRNYDLELTKLKEATQILVPGATYKVTEIDSQGNEILSKIGTTDNEGKMLIKDLLVGKKYVLKEISSPVNYVLNNKEIEFKVIENADDSLTMNVTSENKFLETPVLSVDNNGDSKYSVKVEEEPKYKILLTKADADSGSKLENITFYIPELRRIVTTDTNGQALIDGLVPEKTYTLRELSADGYYLLKDETFKLVKESKGNYKIETSIEGNFNATVENPNDEDLVKVTFELTNEKIPKYNLQIIKVEESDNSEELKPLSNAKFKIYMDDKNVEEEYTTDENGCINLEGLYYYIDGKNATGIYKLTETETPEGYLTNNEEIEFRVIKNNDNIAINIENRDSLDSLQDAKFENGTLKLIIKNKPLFKLKKIDKDTNEPIENVGFTIYKIDNNGKVIDYAKDIKGNYVGTKNSDGNYVVKTGANGEINLPLESGRYKAVETEYVEGYLENDEVQYFTINESEEEDLYTREYTNTVVIDSIEDLLDFANDMNQTNDYNYYEDTLVTLARTLDFEDDNSYNDPSRTDYGDINGDNEVKSIKEELTTGSGFPMIATNVDKQFRGIFDGKGNEIKNLYINIAGSSSTNVGFFANTNGAIIKNLSLQGEINVEQGGNVGGFIGEAGWKSGLILSNLKSNIDITSSKVNNLGSIAGKTDCNSGIVYKCINRGNINFGKADYVGGLFGYCRLEKVDNCSNSGNVTRNTTGAGQYIYLGGVIGYSASSGMTVENTYNKGDITGDVKYMCGVIAGGSVKTVENCYNSGNLTIQPNDYYIYVSGVSDRGNVINCHNSGNITFNNTLEKNGGIIATVSYYGNVDRCYNSGDVFVHTNYFTVEGISRNNATNSYNTGNITVEGTNVSSSSKICAVKGTNVYNTGKLICNANNSSITPTSGKNTYNIGAVNAKEVILGDKAENNSYYLATIPIVSEKEPSGTTIPVNDSMLRSLKFFNDLNAEVSGVENAWVHINNLYPKLEAGAYLDSNPEGTELIFRNENKNFMITTDVKSINGVKGGSISGEDEFPYETVKFLGNNKKQIKMTPNNGFGIVNITVNNEQIDFDTNSDGTYELEEFTDVLENKHIVVEYQPNDTVLTIYKVDANDETVKLKDAKFKVSEIDEREEIPASEIGELTANAPDYYFVEKDGKYVSNNQGKRSTTAMSYIPIDLSNYSGKYNVTINAEISSRSSDYGYIIINEDPTTQDVSASKRISRLSGDKEAQDYTAEIDGGKIYYLHFMYQKGTLTGSGTDTFTINSVSVTPNKNYSIVKEVTTDSKGEAKVGLSISKYKIEEIEAPDGYYLAEPIIYTMKTGEDNVVTIKDTEKSKVIVHHYLEGTGPENGKEAVVLKEDEIYRDDIGKDYVTSPRMDIENYQLIKDNEGNYIIPSNASGKYTDETIEVTYYYRLKEHTIITRVEILEGQTEEGGDISGNGQIPYEKVVHGENSVKEIIMKPDDGYKFNKLVINKYSDDTLVDSRDVIIDEEPDGSFDLPQIKNVVNDYEIIVQYVPDKGRVIVHHYIDGTEISIAPDELIEGDVGSIVNTSSVDTSEYDLIEDSAEYTLVKSLDNRDVTIERDEQEITYYYQRQYKITTEVVPYTEVQSDATTELIKGGTITGEGENPYEGVVKGNNSKKEIKAVPDEGFEIVGMKINGKTYDYTSNLYEDGTVTLNQFINMQENKHIQVEYRRKSNVIVQYILKQPDGTTVLYSENEIPGYVGKDYDTSRLNIPNYVASEDESGNTIPANKDGLMGVETIYVKYYYEKIPSGITVKHIEKVTKKTTDETTGEETTSIVGEAIDGVDDEYIYGYVGDEEITNRKELAGFISAEPILPQVPVENLINAAKDDNRITVTYRENDVIEIVYWYEREFKITTDVKEHKEEITNETTGQVEEVNVKGGKISGELTPENQAPYEKVLRGRDSTKEIKIEPDYGYRIKSVTIKDGNQDAIEIDITNFMQVDEKTAIIPEAYFKYMQSDKHIEVEFEKIPAKVVVKYIDIETGREIHDQKVVDGFVKDPYNENRIDIETYVAANPEPSNKEGEMTEDTITVIYYYQRQYKITTDVVEHEEVENKPLVDVVIDENDESTTDDPVENKIMVKGGSITGELTPENTNPLEIVVSGNNSTKEIVMTPDPGYKIKSLTIYYGEEESKIYLDNILEENGGIIIPAGYFENIHSDVHVEVEYEPIPSKVIVNYKDIEDEKEVAKQEIGKGFVGYDYKTYAKEIPYYELVKEKLPENAEGVLVEEDTIVNYWYKKLLFNMKIKKEFISIQVNGNETLGEDKKFAKIDLKDTDLNKTNIIVKYKITVSNVEKIAGVATIKEQIPVGFKFVNAESDGWTLTDGKYEKTTNVLEPNEEAEYEVILEWDSSKKIIGNLENIARIAETENEPEFEETTLEDNQDSCMLIISIRTGEDRTVRKVISIVCFVIAGMLTIYYIASEIYFRRKL